MIVRGRACVLSRMSVCSPRWAIPRAKGGHLVRIPSVIRTAVTVTSQDRGATTAEYALLASLIAIVVLAAVLFLGVNLLGLFDESASSYSDAA